MLEPHTHQYGSLLTRMKPPSKPERIRIIAEMMEGGEWSPKTGPKMAKTWGLHLTTVKEDAAEASRRIRAAISDDEVREWADSWLERLCEEARESGDYRACVAAIKARVDIRGIIVKRHEMTHREAKMSDQEIVDYALEYLRKQGEERPEGEAS